MATEMPTSDSPAVAGRGTGKIAPIAGILFVVLFVVSFSVLSTPDGDASDEEWLAYWNDSGNRTEGIVASIAMIVAAMVLLWFVGGVRRRFSGAVGIDAAYGAGVVMAALLMFAGFAAGLIPLGNELADVPIPDNPDVVRIIDGGYFGVLFLAVPYAITGLLIPLFVATRGSAFVPNWLRIAGLVIGVIALSGPFLFLIPHLLFLVWTLIFCIFLLARENKTA